MWLGVVCPYALQARGKDRLFSSLLPQLPKQQCSLQASVVPHCEGRDHETHAPSSERPWRHRIPTKVGSNHNYFKAKRYGPCAASAEWICHSTIGWVREQFTMATASRVQKSGYISDSASAESAWGLAALGTSIPAAFLWGQTALHVI